MRCTRRKRTGGATDGPGGESRREEQRVWQDARLTRRGGIHSHRRRGFTLIETVAAVIILAVAIPPMLWAVRQSHHQRVNPILFSKAGFLAMEKVEDIIADRHSVSGNRGYDYLTAANYPAEAMGTITGYPQFSRSVAISETQADLVTAGGGYKKVTVTVGWNDANGNARTLLVPTVLAEYDPI